MRPPVARSFHSIRIQAFALKFVTLASSAPPFAIVLTRILIWGHCGGKGWSAFYVLGRPGTETAAGLVDDLQLVRRLTRPVRNLHLPTNGVRGACEFWLRDFSSGDDLHLLSAQDPLFPSQLPLECHHDDCPQHRSQRNPDH